MRRCAAYKARALPPRPARPRAARTRSTSATPSGTRSRRRPATRSRTDGRSRSACSPRSASRAATRAPVEEVLAPEPVRVDRDRAWEALLRDKKGRLRIVLLGDDGAREEELPEADVRAALDALIAG